MTRLTACSPLDMQPKSSGALRRLALCLICALLSAPAFAQMPAQLSVAHDWDPLQAQFAAVMDVGGDGRQELVVKTRSRRHLEILRPDPSAHRGYTTVARIPGGARSIFWLRVLDVDGDALPDLCVSYFNSGVRIFSGRDLSLRGVLPGTVTGIGFGDVDGDQIPELVTQEAGRFKLLDPRTFQVRGSFVGPNGSGHIIVGDISGDGRAEIVVEEGKAIEVQRSGQTWTATTVWQSPEGALAQFALHDVDGDGKQEILDGDRDGVGIHRAGPTPSYTRIASYELAYAYWFGDANDDGSLDIVTATSQGGSAIEAIDVAGQLLWRLPQAVDLHGAAIALADFQGTGAKSLIRNSHVEPLVAGTAPTWHTLHPEAIRSSTVLRAPGQPAALTILTYSSGAGDPLVEFRSGSALSESGHSGDDWRGPPLAWPRVESLKSIVAIPSDSRPDEALAVVAYESSVNTPHDPASRLRILDGSGAQVRMVDIEHDPRVQSAKRIRMPGESQPHVVLLDVPTDGPASLSVVGTHDGLSIWTSSGFTGSFWAFDPLMVEDLNGDGQPEILLVADGEALIFDPSSGPAPIRRHPFVLGAAAYRPQPQGSAELILSRKGGSIDIYSGLAEFPSRAIDLGYETWVMAAFVEPHSGRGTLVTLEDFPGRVFALDLATGVRIASHSATDHFLVSSRAEATDIDGDGTMEIVMTSDEQVVFRLDAGSLFANGLETGLP
jgi:hypothetical protein